MVFQCIESLGRRRNGDAAARKISAQNGEGSVHKHLNQMDLIRSWPRCEIPEVGIQGLIGRGADKPGQRMIVVQDGHHPETAAQGE